MELSARVRKLTEKYGMNPEDVAFVDMIHAGWNRAEGAYYAYHLAYFDMSKITTWLRDKLRITPGINQMINDLEEEDAANRKKFNDLENALKDANRRNRKSAAASGSNEEALTKEDLGKVYSKIVRDPLADSKTIMDAAKGYSALYQMNKVEEKVEDSRISFYMPLTCSKCSLYKEFKENQKKEKK